MKVETMTVIKKVDDWRMGNRNTIGGDDTISIIKVNKFRVLQFYFNKLNFQRIVIRSRWRQ